ncbi:hypothetical protein ACJ41O_006272 [Fusarium nematophilum]
MEPSIAYQPLSEPDHSIRLIKLHPMVPDETAGGSSDNRDILVCDIVAHLRADCPSYTALSYVWAAPGMVKEYIMADGREIPISKTVENALRRLRFHNKVRWLWVDQLCINQTDEVEKSHQVHQMHNIYKDADQVIAWLGPADESSDLICSLMRETGRALRNSDFETLSRLYSGDGQQGSVDLDVAKEAFDRFCQRRYWTRIWVMQEFAVGRRVSIACGNWIVKSDLITATLYATSIIQKHVRKKPIRDLGTLQQNLELVYDSLHSSYVYNLFSRRRRFHQQVSVDSGPETEPLLKVVATCLALEVDYNWVHASDPRDRIFALLNLAGDRDHFTAFPDYTMSVEEVYEETARKILQQGRIDVLMYCQSPKKIKSLPSWVPDWSMEIRHPCAQPPWGTPFEASGTNTSIPTFTEGGLATLEGIHVDKIRETGATWDPNWLEPVDRTAVSPYLKSIRAFCDRSPRIRVGDEQSDAGRIAVLDGPLWSYTFPYSEWPSAFAAGFEEVSTIPKTGNLKENGIDGADSSTPADSRYAQMLLRMHSRPEGYLRPASMLSKVGLLAMLSGISHAAYVQFQDCRDIDASNLSDSRNPQMTPESFRASVNTISDAIELTVSLIGTLPDVSHNYCLSSNEAAFSTGIVPNFTVLDFLGQHNYAGRVINSSCNMLDTGGARLRLEITSTFNQSAILDTFDTTLELATIDGNALTCARASLTPQVRRWIQLLSFWMPVIAFCMAVIVALWSVQAQGRCYTCSDLRGMNHDYSVARVADALAYIQFIFLSGALSLRYPGFFQPLVASSGWSTLMLPAGPVSRSSPYKGVRDGIYETNGTMTGAPGLELLTQLTASPVKSESWFNTLTFTMMVLLFLCVSDAPGQILSLESQDYHKYLAHRIMNREFKALLGDYEDGGKSIDLAGFLKSVQGEDIGSKLTRFSPGLCDQTEAKVSISDLLELLLSKENSALQEEPASYVLGRPINEYFISSSHNTYLSGRQVIARSTIQGYISALSRGCRCIEVDCWDGRDGQPIVKHGYSLTTRISFRDVMETIKQYAFVCSDFPLWISLEVHCTAQQRNVMARTMRESFGSCLVTEPLPGFSQSLPSPSHLKGRILIKTKVLPDTDPYEETQEREKSGSVSRGTDSSSDELAKLAVYGAGKKLPPWGQLDTERAFIYSVSETNLKSRLKGQNTRSSVGPFHNQHMIRVYPDATRIDSSNLSPLRFWPYGVQMVAVNYQTNGLSLELNSAMFAGGTDVSGYVLKPENPVRREELRIVVDVIMAKELSWPSSHASNLGAYVEMEILIADGNKNDAHEATTTSRSKARTRRVKFVPPKSLKPRPPRELVTENDLRRAQGGKNRRIAPKHSRSGHEKEDVPYEFATKGGRSAPFFFELMKAWRQVNDTEHQRHPSPTRFILPNWTLHGLPKDISDEGRMCFHSYLFSCPIRHYPFEQAQITSWQPLSKDQERFQRLMLEPLTLRCTLTMGALFLLLKSGKNESAGFSMHSARLCALVNQLLGDKRQTLDKKIVVIQSVACLALLATFLGLYDHWYAHVNGLKLLIQEVGGFQAVPAPVQLLAKK